MGEDAPQVPMDPPTFMLALLLMIDAEYQLKRGGIVYIKWLLGDLDYMDFSKDCLISHFPIRLCTSSLLSFPSFYPVYLTCDDIQMW